jgi:hypothetical protein
MEKIIVSTKQLSNFFGVTPQAIALWHRRGCRKLMHGRWDLKAVFNWYLINVLDLQNGEAGSLADVKLSYWQARTEREFFELEIKKKKFLSLSEIEAGWAYRVGVVASGLEALKFRLPPLLEGKTRREIAKILDVEIYELRKAYEKKGKYCPEQKTENAE